MKILTDAKLRALLDQARREERERCAAHLEQIRGELMKVAVTDSVSIARRLRREKDAMLLILAKSLRNLDLEEANG